MKTSTLIGEVGPDGKLRVDLPADVPQGPVDVVVRVPGARAEPVEDLLQILKGARARIEAAGESFLDDRGVQAAIDEIRGEEDRLDTIDREIDATKHSRATS